VAKLNWIPHATYQAVWNPNSLKSISVALPYDEGEQLPTIIPYPLAQSALNFWQQQCDRLAILIDKTTER